MTRQKLKLDWKKIDKLILEGNSQACIAFLMDINPTTLLNHMKATFDMNFSEYRKYLLGNKKWMKTKN